MYLGAGASPYPKEDAALVDREFGHGVGEEVRSILDELSHVAVDWSTTSLVEGGEVARAAIKRTHPELSDEALDALRWKFTYDWR